MSERLTIRECAAATGTSPDTLRYYEKIGLLTRIARARNGHRSFSADDVRWITFLRRLHATGMPIRHMLQYARLVRRGESTVSERRALLETHRNELRSRVAALSEHLTMIERKIRFYSSAEPSSLNRAPGSPV
jgi:DNA-binding transcriptional MerR regulator